MFLIIILSIILIASTILSYKTLNYLGKFYDLLGPVYLLIAIASFIVLAGLLSSTFYKETDADLSMQEYDEIGRLINSGADTEALALIYDRGYQINASILRARYWKDSIWIGCIYSKRWADMPLLDLPIKEH